MARKKVQKEEKTTTQRFDRGRILTQWSFPEYDRPERGPAWYTIALLIIGVLMTYALLDSNFLFALIILLFAFILFTHHRSEPLTIPFAIYERGVQIGDRFYLYRELESFAIIYEPPIVERLYIIPRDAFIRREIGIPLLGKDPIEIRSLLIDMVKEDLEREAESTNDIITRLLKL